MNSQKGKLLYIVSTNQAWKEVVLAILASGFDSKTIVETKNTDNLWDLSSESIVIVDKSSLAPPLLSDISPPQRGGHWLIVNAGAADEANISSIISLGFSGLITTEFTLEMLTRAIRTIQKNQLWFSRDAMSLALKVLVQSADNCQNSLNDLGAKYTLSCREKQVFFHLLNGSSNKEIANQLHLSPSTIKCHVSSILLKTGKRSRSQINMLLMDTENNNQTRIN
ncbi:response regulator transcription factor [Shewanella sp. 10N.261.52.F9]|uniref:helix-turn-helix transcriptional regulator n=1 Tax=Shewanella TaxID=22 RepID=UPI00200CD388|nr:LuxR C-terminal-related transcriptional regulator [Shewanella marinintestina]MCL1147026.1 LuxR C-terminal-related transcriptional regulator [Shewanella marinintestina]